MDKVSIVIPIYNAEKTLMRCISSVQKQNYNNIEIICVNDGSKDNSLQLLNKFSKIDSRIRIINQENQGAFVARKVGVFAATGKYLMFLDADDEIIDNNAILDLVSILNKYDVQMVQFGSKLYYNKLIHNDKRNQFFQKTSRNDLIHKYYSDYISDYKGNVIFVTLWGKIYLSKIVKASYSSCIDYKMPLGEDVLCLLLIISNENLKNIYTIPQVYYRYNSYLGGSKDYDYTVLSEYGNLKRFQNELCKKWNLPDDAIFNCNLESIYFLRSCVIDMIRKNIEKKYILKSISEANSYDCIVMAKEFFRNYRARDKIWDELVFLSSDYTPEQYYEYLLKNKPTKNLKNIIKSILHI